ncbi:sensor histidine kinase [Planomonospora parontospora]|uniref:sensor histidine kinase n=1 Tax=Planomonospora parontospora TaxID=58119 RepID=UPI00167058C3|nr:HAMP domain-containing sensor histidine kinase [Planomonospora parontospora]GGL49117.1 two-component sensor histidine kinase [Planomonospora parontospora subsp. antibiotica]GII18933.1 two-component sensor histidine kinase [Planomonospora parontospora subsp. antibiotica]
MAPWPSLGLRARLSSAFALLCVVTTAAVAGGIYVQARNAILQRTQDAAVQAMTSRLEALYPLRNPAPDRAELGDIADAVSDGNVFAVAFYRGEHSPVGPPPERPGAPAPGPPPEHRRPGGDPPVLDLGVIPPELRRTVAGGGVAWQRVVRRDAPFLIIGTPLLITERDRTARPSGIEVYAARSLLPEQRSIDELAVRAWLTGGAALAFALLLAWLATRGVLRPVRELGRAARLLGEGELHTRIAVRGSDELAGVARTFNTTAAELQRHVEQLRQMEADARRFVADVSHELRTPLAALAAVADVLDEEAARLPEPSGRAARLVSQETLNLTALVNDLIEISRFDSGVAALALNEVDVAELVRATLRARGWSEAVRTELPPGVTALLDPRRVDVILANLVGNALRHGEPPVSVRLSADPHRITLEVRDHGPGLDEAVLPHVFDRFYKAGTARARSEGSGLGLSIARENARLHRGDLTAADAPDGGAVFTLRLPRRAPDPDGGPE